MIFMKPLQLAQVCGVSPRFYLCYFVNVFINLYNLYRFEYYVRFLAFILSLRRSVREWELEGDTAYGITVGTEAVQTLSVCIATSEV